MYSSVLKRTKRKEQRERKGNKITREYILIKNKNAFFKSDAAFSKEN